MLTQAETNKRFYTQEEISRVRKKGVPHHVALIMDGNRRWTKRNKLTGILDAFEGHHSGAKALVAIVQAALELGVKVITTYGFSTENRGRTPQEIQRIYQIIEFFLKDHLEKMVEVGVKFNTIGAIDAFPSSLRKVIENVKEKTKEGTNIEFFVALNYGARDEMKRAVQRMVHDILEEKILPESISEDLIGSYLDTNGLQDPDLLIRTSGEMRISNFLLWQLAYSEIYVTDTLWPDFSPTHFLNAIEEYQKRERRIGK